MTDKKTPADLGEQLDELAVKLVEAVLDDDTPLDTRIDVMKVVGNFYISRTKANGKARPDDEEASNFKNFGDRIRAVS